MSRRRVVQSSLAAGATWHLAARTPLVLGAARTKPYRTALVGTGWWGMNILRYAIESKRVSVVGMCDVDEGQLGPAREEVRRLTGAQAKPYKDFRELIKREKPEIVIVGTPDHWHPLVTIEAVKVGAHVYVEKPVGHTIHEGRAMVKAARDAQRLVQVGTHRRVSPHNRSGMEFLKSGKAGKIGMVRAFVHYPGGPGTPTPDSEPPKGLDWNMWCGPAPLRPFNKALHPKGFRQFMDYANGQLGDWGIHWMDQILWWTEEKWPRTVFSTGGRLIKKDSTDAPDTQIATFEFEGFRAVWEHRQYAGNEAEKTNIGCYFYGDKGTFHMGWQDGWTFYPSKKGDPVVHEDARLNGKDKENIRELWADFLDAIEKNRRPVCDIEIGNRSTNMSLLGVLSMKLGRSVRWNGETDTVVGDEEANGLLARTYRAPWVYPK
jgi:predicted dehydrogenase